VDGPIARQQRLEVAERVVRRGPARGVGVAGVDQAEFAAPGLEAEEGLGPEEAEPADLLAADDALE